MQVYLIVVKWIPRKYTAKVQYSMMVCSECMLHTKTVLYVCECLQQNAPYVYLYN